MSRPALVPPAPILSVTPALLGPLLANLRVPGEICAYAERPARLARALFLSWLPDPLVAAFHTLAALATDRGFDALVEARLDLARLGVIDALDDDAFGDMSAPDLAALAVTRATGGDATWERTIERAMIRLHRSLPDPIGYELWARVPFASFMTGPNGTPDRGRIAAALAELPGLTGPAWIAEDAHVVHAALFHAVRPRAIVGRRDGELVALAVDGTAEPELVSLYPAAGRVSMITRDASRVRRLAKILAAHVSIDEELLLARPAFTLQSLLDMGISGVARVSLPGRVRAVSVIAAQVIAQDGERIEARAKDALTEAQKLAASRDGYLHRVTLRFTIEGASTPIDAFVELPNRLAIGDARSTKEVRGALDALGIMAPGLARDDLTTLRRSPRGRFRFAEVIGEAGVAFMMAGGILQRVPPDRTSAVTSSATRAWGHSIRPFVLHHPLDDGHEYVIADDPIVQGRTVGPEHRETWRLDPVALARTMAADLGLDTRRPKLALPDDVLDLGATPDGRARVLYVLASVAPERRGELGKALAHAVLPAHAVVLVPQGRELGRELEIALDLEEQIGMRSAREKLDAALAILRAPVETAPSEATPTKPATSELVLSVPGSWDKQRTHVALNGEVRAVRNGAFFVLLTAIVSGSRTPGSWSDLPKGFTPKTIREAMSRMHADLEDVTGGERVIEARLGRTRLSPKIRVGDVQWKALAVDHEDERIRKLAAIARRAG